MKFPDVCRKVRLKERCLFFLQCKENYTMSTNDEQNATLIPDLTDVEEARKAFIASEIFNRKY